LKDYIRCLLAPKRGDSKGFDFYFQQEWFAAEQLHDSVTGAAQVGRFALFFIKSRLINPSPGI